jgi:5-methylcytosine-specific restriction enzyme subunit McrC
VKRHTIYSTCLPTPVQLPIREYNLAPLLKRRNDWFEVLTRFFASHLLEEWQRGAYRNYQIVEEDLSVLKGKWRIADQLHHPLRQHIFAVAYDEFTADEYRRPIHCAA